MNTVVRTEDVPEYATSKTTTMAEEDAVIAEALRILEGRMSRPSGPAFCSPIDVKAYCRLMLGEYQYEVFSVLFLDAKNCLIATEQMFRGTLTQTSVYPREVLVRALHHHSSAVILTHNHPSGSLNPSRADSALTQTLKSALALVDVRVLDHIIVTPSDALSMAEKGMV